MAGPQDRSASPERLHALADGNVLSRDALGRALELASASPDAAMWRRSLDLLLLSLGSTLLIVGVFCFFAYNWDDIHPFVQLGLVAAVILACAVAAWVLGREHLSGQIALLAASVLVGALLGVYVRIYQPNVHAWQILSLWAVLTVPWLLVSRMQLHWLLWLVLLGVSVGTWGAVYLEEEGALTSLLLFAIGGGSWVLRETLPLPWFHGRWMPRVLAVTSLVILLWPAVWFIGGETDRVGYNAIGFLFELLLIGWIFFRYIRPPRDLLLVAAAAGTGVVLSSTFLARLFFDWGDIGNAGVLLLGLAILGQVAWVAWWIRQLSREDAS